MRVREHYTPPQARRVDSLCSISPRRCILRLGRCGLYRSSLCISVRVRCPRPRECGHALCPACRNGTAQCSYGVARSLGPCGVACKRECEGLRGDGRKKSRDIVVSAAEVKHAIAHLFAPLRLRQKKCTTTPFSDHSDRDFQVSRVLQMCSKGRVPHCPTALTPTCSPQ